jgi:hypothetical protein
MKKLSKIVESLWSDLQDRSSGDVVRKEDGIKVHTCLDIDILLKNPNCDYNGLIHDIVVGGDNEYEFGIHKLNDMSYTPDERVNVMKFGAPYDYLIYEGGHGTDLVATFSSYSELLEFNLDDDFEDEYCEEDYISICRGIATKVKEIGDCFVYVPRRNTFMISVDRQDTSDYEGDYCLELISENGMFDWIVEHSDEQDIDLNDFKNDIIDEFPELRDMDFIGWSYTNNGGCYVGIPAYNINNLLNIRKYKEFTEKWFKV